MDALNDANALVLFVGLASLAAVLAKRFAAFASIPAPAIFLLGGTIAATMGERTHNFPALTNSQVAHIGTFALIIILFEGGFGGGLARARRAAGPILWLGLPGTLMTAALMWGAGCLLGLDAGVAALVAIAIAPTDPAAVFSVLGAGTRLRGRSGIILEGESGANDPVGISLMLGALAYVAREGSLGNVALDISGQLVIGVIVGVLGGYGLTRLLRLAQLGAASMGALTGVAGAFVIYALGAYLHGSGFLAVFVAGLIVGDHALHDDSDWGSGVLGFAATLSEIVMFSMLGLTISLTQLGGYAVLVGLALFLLLTLVARPLVVIAPLKLANMTMGERIFVSWGGLKGAVPILLAEFALLAHVDHGRLVYQVVFVTVTASILVQGASLSWVARRTGAARDDGTPG
ncbi:MAG: cation:proton antiporter [Thermoleophilia bacterium]|nr:cation:proton antiporter [Thermoleophilia bacterium]